MSEIQGIGPPDTSPSRLRVPLYIQNIDRTLDRLHTILSTPSGIDTVLLTIAYTSRLSSTALSSTSLHRLHHRARQLARQLLSRIKALSPNATVLIDTSTIPSSNLIIAAARLKALSELVSDFRVFVRLWGLLGIYKWGKNTLGNPPQDQVVRGIVYAQVIAGVFFQYLENGAYLSSKGVLGWSAAKQNKAWRWSSRFWMAHVGLDLVRLYRELVLRKRRGTDEEKRKDGPKGDVITERGEEEWRAAWIKEVVVNAAWYPLTLHWSLEKGLVGDFSIGILGSIAGLAGLDTLWRKSGEV